MTFWAFLNANLIPVSIIALVFIVVIALLVKFLQLSISTKGITLSGKKGEILSEYIVSVVQMEVEKATARDRIKDEGRRIVKNYTNQAVVSMQQIALDARCQASGVCNDRDVYYETITSGQVSNFIVMEVMSILEANHIAEMTDPEWKYKLQKDFDRIFIGAEAIVESSWADKTFDVVIIRNKIRNYRHSFKAIYDNCMDEIRMLAIKYAERHKELDNLIHEARKAMKQ